MALPVPLPGLQPASFRGVGFYVPSATRVVGRRQAEFELAASDITLSEDLGLLRSPIEIEGLYVGDDYMEMEAALRAACEQPGPGTLSHPWYGPLFVELAAQCEIRFDAKSLRSFSFRATFKLFSDTSGVSLLSSLAAMLGAGTALTSAAGALVSYGFGLAFASDVMAVLGPRMANTLATGPAAPMLAASASLASKLAGSGTITTGSDAALWGQSIMAIVAGGGVPAPTPAIAPGPLGRDISSVLTPKAALDGLLGLATLLSPQVNGLASDTVLRAGLRAMALAATPAPLGVYAYTSRAQAMVHRDVMVAAFNGAMADAGALSASIPSLSGPLWQALGEARRRVVEDIDERIGRLPAVRIIEAPVQTSAWLLAHYAAGDTPGRIVDMMNDIVVRNRLPHPAIAGPGPLEVLP